MRPFKLASSAALFFFLSITIAARAEEDVFNEPKATNGGDHPLASGSTDPSRPSAVAPTASSHWYGAEILVPDLASLALLGIGLSSNDGTVGSLSTLWGTGMLIYLAGGPIVHGIHEQGGKVGLSIGLRLLGPIAGALAARSAGESACPRNSDCPDGYALLGFMGGMATASLLDVAFLAREPDPKQSAPVVRVAPNIALGRNAANIGLAGEF